MSAQHVGTLLITCPDQKGIVAAVAQMLFALGANIIDSEQHTDHVAGMFFQRIRFELDGDRTTIASLGLAEARSTPNGSAESIASLGFAEARSTPNGSAESIEHSLRGLAPRFHLQWRVKYGATLPRVAIFCSKQEHCLYDLLIRYRAGELPCEVGLVISNHPTLAHVAQHFGVPYHHLPIAPETKAAQEAEVLALLDQARIDLVVLARYMQILSPELVARYPARIINIHHSFLPAFVGANPYRQAYEKGVKLIGATSHYVTAELDQGPIIEQAVVRCSHRDHPEELVRKGKDLEAYALSRAVRAHLEDRVLVYAGKTVVFE